jgi:hypothetical protein
VRQIHVWPAESARPAEDGRKKGFYNAERLLNEDAFWVSV